MTYLTEDLVRRRAQARAQKYGRTVQGALKAEARKDATRYDVFLSQTIHDREIVFGVYTILTEDLGLTVFCDWVESPQTDRSAITPENARYVRDRMERSDTLLFVDSDSADQSKWMCWEIGWFDGAKGKVGVLPVVKTSSSPYRGREFLGLYPRVETDDVHKLKIASLTEEELRAKMAPGRPYGLVRAVPLTVWTQMSTASLTHAFPYRTERTL
jgi:hypothetical protein